MGDGDEQGIEPVPWDAPWDRFIEVTDVDGGQVMLNVEKIVGVFEVIGRALAAAPAGTLARIMLIGGVNVPTRSSIEEIRAVLSEIAILGRAEPVKVAPSPVLYIPRAEP